MMDDEEAVEQAASKSLHCDEVHSRNGFAMIVQECSPAPCRLSISRSLPHPPQNGSLGDVETEHFQFAVNPGRTPSRVLLDHSEDEQAELRARRFAPNWNMPAGQPFAIHLES
jgi:hypothetical protein